MRSNFIFRQHLLGINKESTTNIGKAIVLIVAIIVIIIIIVVIIIVITMILAIK